MINLRHPCHYIKGHSSIILSILSLAPILPKNRETGRKNQESSSETGIVDHFVKSTDDMTSHDTSTGSNCMKDLYPAVAMVWP